MALQVYVGYITVGKELVEGFCSLPYKDLGQRFCGLLYLKKQAWGERLIKVKEGAKRETDLCYFSCQKFY